MLKCEVHSCTGRPTFGKFGGSSRSDAQIESCDSRCHHRHCRLRSRSRRQCGETKFGNCFYTKKIIYVIYINIYIHHYHYLSQYTSNTIEENSSSYSVIEYILNIYHAPKNILDDSENYFKDNFEQKFRDNSEMT